jgi:hypothetical protein
VHPAGAVLDEYQDSVESGMSLLSAFALPRVDDRQMTISLGQAQSGNEEEAGAWKRLVCPLSDAAGSRSTA